VEGIDAIQIGSNDLTTAMGIPGEYRHERVRTVYGKVIEACKAAGKPLIIGGIRKADELEPYVRMGAARCYFTGGGQCVHARGCQDVHERGEERGRRDPWVAGR
jgi:2-keto-3-deoxy-L-rhamnonate aldolase RhmA